MNVIKRNGDIVAFDKNKIISAINKAFIEVDGQLYETDTSNSIAEDIAALDKEISVEEIQDLVEEYLMQSERKDVARAYIRYRYKREVARNWKDDFGKEITRKLMAKEVDNSNANVDEHSFGGRIGEASNVLLEKYALDNCMSTMAKNNHLNNEVYIHDLNYYAVGAHNCLSIPFDDLLAKGFNTRQTDVRSAGSVNTAFQLVAVIFQIQSLSQFGGVSATHLDWTMVPYVRKSFFKHYTDGMMWCENADDYCTFKKDEKYNNTLSIEDKLYKRYKKAYDYAMIQTIKETHQAVEGLYHNLSN